MLNYYQPFLLPFLRMKKYTLNSGVARNFYISFEDALWNILPSLGVPKGSVILVPDFYCMDVVGNIRSHGYRCEFYPLDNHFAVTKEKLHSYVKKYTPAAVILFHACGITNTLLTDKIFVRRLAEKTLVIEDAVHRLLNPEQIRIVHDRHIVIDSLRKVSPLHGSFAYGTPLTVSKIEQPPASETGYRMRTELLFFLFRFVFLAGIILKSARIVRYSHAVVLKNHDDLIGDSRTGHPGPGIIPIAHRHLNFAKAEKIKQRQALTYRRLLNSFKGRKNPWYQIRFPDSDLKKLHVYPVAFVHSSAMPKGSVDSFLSGAGIPVWSKYPDSPWSRHRSVLFLPLGLHVRYNEIERICGLLRQFPVLP